MTNRRCYLFGFMKSHFRNKKIVVMGLGLNGGGVGAATFFAKCGAKVLVTDLRTKKELEPSLRQLKKWKNIRYSLGGHKEGDFLKADIIIKNPAVTNNSKFIKLARKKGVPIETDMSIFEHLCPAPIIGITGTKGKTTTATIIGRILQQWDSRTILAGNLRVSALQFLPSLIDRKKDYPWVVLELSSWQLEGSAHVARSPKIAVVTNVFEDHLDRYDTFEDYIQAKKIILNSQNEDDTTVLNADNEITRGFADIAAGKVVWFSYSKLPAKKKGVYVLKNEIWSSLGEKPVRICKLKSLQFQGQHVVLNTCAAIAVALTVGVPIRTIKSALKKAVLPDGRMEVIQEKKGVVYMNDTTATVPGATMATLSALCDKKKKQKVILIAGGISKNVGYEDLAAQARKMCKAIIVLSTGKRETGSAQLKAELSGYKPIVSAETMEHAVQLASEYAKSGDVIVLSPASASFGMFQNEFDRGDQFNLAVEELCRR
jgi:UDP-N-acetylmuramoylalanine--D-glutamate ligase